MEVAVRQQSLCLLLEDGENRKSRALRINCRMCDYCFKTQFGNVTSGWISSENVLDAPTRKRETLPKWADLLKKETFRCPRGRRIFLHKILLSERNKG